MNIKVQEEITEERDVKKKMKSDVTKNVHCA